MDMDSKGKRRLELHRSFGFAIAGILTGLKQERNIRIHSSVSIIVIVLGIIYSLDALEWLFILIAIGGMLSLELLNSAIERVVDLVTEDYHPLAKQAKDMAAGAVLLYAILSVVIGFIVFLPKIF
jgi:undecaprenol kinase